VRVKGIKIIIYLITFRGCQVSIPEKAYGDPALKFNKKYLNSCSEDKQKVLRGWNNMRVSKY